MGGGNWCDYNYYPDTQMCVKEFSTDIWAYSTHHGQLEDAIVLIPTTEFDINGVRDFEDGDILGLMVYDESKNEWEGFGFRKLLHEESIFIWISPRINFLSFPSGLRELLTNLLGKGQGVSHNDLVQVVYYDSSEGKFYNVSEIEFQSNNSPTVIGGTGQFIWSNSGFFIVKKIVVE